MSNLKRFWKFLGDPRPQYFVAGMLLVTGIDNLAAGSYKFLIDFTLCAILLWPSNSNIAQPPNTR